MYKLTVAASRSERKVCENAAANIHRFSTFTAIVTLIALVLGGVPQQSVAATVPPERALVGVKIFDKAVLVLKKFGNPAKIITPATTATSGTVAAPTAPGPVGPQPGEFGGPGAGMPAPGAAPGSAAAAATAAANTVIYEYNTKAGITLDFTMSNDGRVIQISASGQKNANVKTSRGVTLGTSYIDVINKYGYPESQDTVNSVLTMRYVEKAHVAFQLFNQKVVSVTVAAVE
ncbi:MAG TPA: hypothetical protein VGK19_13930 [Capsulimonadaceae bacterium]|jgi:hypothetical protein